MANGKNRPAGSKSTADALDGVASDLDRCFLSREVDNIRGSDALNVTDALLAHARAMEKLASAISTAPTSSIEIEKLADSMKELADAINSAPGAMIGLGGIADRLDDFAKRLAKTGAPKPRKKRRQR